MTKKEQQRLDTFEEKSKALIEQGYTREDLLIGPVMANTVSLLVVLPFIAPLVLLYLNMYLDLLKEFSFGLNYIKVVLGLILFFALVFVHEAIHGTCWAISNSKHAKAIDFGFSTKALAPYCTCTEPLTKAQYIIGALMPTIVLALCPAIICLINGSLILLTESVFMFMGGGADIMMSIKIARFNKKTSSCIFQDHPTSVGSVAFYK